MSSEKCASKAPGREARRVPWAQRWAESFPQGCRACKGSVPQPLLSSQSSDEGPVPAQCQAHNGLWQMLPIHWQAASIHF